MKKVITLIAIYYSNFEEKMIVGYLEGALKELED